MAFEQDTGPVPPSAYTSPLNKTFSAVLQDNDATKMSDIAYFLHLKDISEPSSPPSIADNEIISSSNSSLNLQS